jgi:hypothetical protein
MAVWGDSKRDMVVAENAAMQREIELLREQIADLKQERLELKDQLKFTQEALVAKESPEAYREKKWAEAQAIEPTPEELAAHKKREQQAEITKEYVRAMEGDLFTGADEMMQLLNRAGAVPLSEDVSFHGNDES